MATHREKGKTASVRRPQLLRQERISSSQLPLILPRSRSREAMLRRKCITHFLKLATTREKLEQERIRSENKLLEAKVESLAAAGRVEELYKKALQAMRSYAGSAGPDERRGLRSYKELRRIRGFEDALST